MKDGTFRGSCAAVLGVVVVTMLGFGGGPVAAATTGDCGPVVHANDQWRVGMRASKLSGAAAVGPGDVWVVGGGASPDDTAPAALHWAGIAWAQVPLPARIGHLSGVTAFQAADVWAVGRQQDATTNSVRPWTVHWDGSAWTTVASPDLPPGPDGPAAGYLRAVAGSSATDLWAVGSGILHGTGTGWQVAPVSIPPGTRLDLQSVAATGPNDAWAVGQMQAPGQAGLRPLLLRWNGTAWAPGPALPAGVVPHAVGAIRGQAGVWVVGQGSAHWDGHAWTAVPVPDLRFSFLNSLTLIADGTAWATSERVTSPTETVPSTVYHWDGRRWAVVPGHGQGGAPYSYYAIAAEGPDRAWAVGMLGASAPRVPPVVLLDYVFGPCGLPSAAVTDPRAAGVRYFPEVRHTLRGPFGAYWEAHGGLAQFGYPITEEYNEPSATDGKTYRVQYFQRNRFEYHPENAGTPYEVLLGLLGRTVTAGLDGYIPLSPLPGPPAGATARFFPATGHTLAAELDAYWTTHGGLAVYGYPISEPLTLYLDDKPYLVQYFERNRLEYHPDFPPAFRISLGLLGAEVLHQRGWLP